MQTANRLIAFFPLDDSFPTSIEQADVCRGCALDDVVSEIADYLEESFERPIGYHYYAEDGAVYAYDFEGKPSPSHYEAGDKVLVYNTYDDMGAMHCGVVVGPAAVPDGYRVIDEYGGVHAVSTEMIFRLDRELPQTTCNRLLWLATHDRIPRKIYTVKIIEYDNGRLYVNDFASFTLPYAAEEQVMRLNEFNLHYAQAIVITSQPVNELYDRSDQVIEHFYTVDKEPTNFRILFELSDYDGISEVLRNLNVDPEIFKIK